jgi:hypothetical protein
VIIDGKSGWIVRGSLLEVVDISTSKRCAAWQFGRILSDEHTNVTCVEEFRFGQTRKLLVGVCNASPIGLICVFDVALSKVIKAVEIPHPVRILYFEVKYFVLFLFSSFCDEIKQKTNLGQVRQQTHTGVYNYYKETNNCIAV